MNKENESSIKVSWLPGGYKERVISFSVGDSFSTLTFYVIVANEEKYSVTQKRRLAPDNLYTIQRIMCLDIEISIEFA